MATLLWVNGANHRFNLPCAGVTHSITVIPPTPPPNPANRPYPGVLYGWEVIAVVGGSVDVWDSGSGFSPGLSRSSSGLWEVSWVPFSPEYPRTSRTINFAISEVIEFRLTPMTPEPGAPNDPNRQLDPTYRLRIFVDGSLYLESESNRLPNVQKQCEDDCPPGCRKVVLSQNTGDYCCCPVKCC